MGSGKPGAGMSQALPEFPDDTVQYVCSEWWRHAPEQTLCRGRLIRAFVPHIDQEPYILITEGRAAVEGGGRCVTVSKE